jgi:hypothetical protein
MSHAVPDHAASLLQLLSVGVLSYRAHLTLRRALELHQRAGLPALAGEFFVYFNALCAEDERIAQDFGVDHCGSRDNLGIYGGFRGIAERATRPYVVILENDIVPLGGADIAGCLQSCLSDMLTHGIKVFALHSRAKPGQGRIWRKYVRCFPVHDPINDEIEAQKLPVLARLRMLAEHGYFSKFRGTAIYAEKHPERAQPKAIKRLASGNYLTDSRFRNWTNQSLLVERDFFIKTICRFVEEHPDLRLVNGHQDIERSLNSWRWRLRREPLGHAADGIFTHARLDR